MWCYIRIFCVLFLSILYTNAVNMCKNQTAGGNDVTLNLAPGTYVSGCNCSVKPVNIGSVKITFETIQFSGCKYKLVVSYKDRNSIISCSDINTIFYNINKSDEIKLYLEPSTSQDETTTFEVRITSSITVNVCTNQSASDKDVSLSLVPGTYVSGCNCIVKFDNPDKVASDKPKMFFEVVNFSGCKYRLVISYKDKNSRISCSNNNTIFYDINKSDEIKLYLEPTNSQDETTTFEVKITSSITAIGPLMRLECFAQYTNHSVTTTQSSTRTTFHPTQTHTPNSTKPAYTPTPDDTDQDIGVDIIVGAVGGAFILILIIIIIICIVWRKKKKDEAKKYDKPTVRKSDPGYSNVDILHQGKGNNSSPDGAVIIHNVLYDSSNQNPNTEYAVVDKPTNKMSGDGSDPINDGDSVDQNPETEYAVVNKVKPTKNGNDSMNDSANQKAETQYAVVNKLPKSMDMTPQDGGDPNSPNEPNSDRMFVIGPQGDEYALVERG